MQIFLSYAKEDKSAAESIAFSLRSRGHQVFLDRDDLPAGQGYDQQIEKAVKQSDLFLFLVSPDSIGEGRFTLTELLFARQKWPAPHNRVLPVMVRKCDISQIPTYLKAVTLLEPHGNITAETAAAVDLLAIGSQARETAIKFARFGAASGLIGAFLPYEGRSILGFHVFGQALEVGLVMGLALAAAMYVFSGERSWRTLLMAGLVMIPIWLIASLMINANLTQTTFGIAQGGFSSSDLENEELTSKLDESTLERLKKSVEATDSMGELQRNLIGFIQFTVTGTVVSLLTLLGLTPVFGSKLKSRDLANAAVLGVVSGVLCFASFQAISDLGGPINLLGNGDYKENVLLWSFPALIIMFVIWQAMLFASVGHWIGRQR